MYLKGNDKCGMFQWNEDNEWFLVDYDYVAYCRIIRQLPR